MDLDAGGEELVGPLLGPVSSRHLRREAEDYEPRESHDKGGLLAQDRVHRMAQLDLTGEGLISLSSLLLYYNVYLTKIRLLPLN